MLQSANQDLNTAVLINESLMEMEFIRKLRTRFEEFEAIGKKLGEKLDACINEIAVTMSQD